MAIKKSVAQTALDPTIQFAKLIIDDTEYSLCYSFNAIAEAEAASGTNLLRGLESLVDLSAIQLRGLLYAALLVSKPETTIEDAAKLIRLDTIGPITSALAQAYTLSMPSSKKSEEAEVAASN